MKIFQGCNNKYTYRLSTLQHYHLELRWIKKKAGNNSAIKVNLS